MGDPLSTFELPHAYYSLSTEDRPHETLHHVIEQVKFPNPTRFPPPIGVQGNCGCLLTEWKDYRAGDIRLETIWQPLWSTAIARMHHAVRWARAAVKVYKQHPGVPFTDAEWAALQAQCGQSIN